MRLLIIRHAQSQNNAGIGPRVADPTLTEIGDRQAELAATALRAFALDVLYVSPMRRTLQTAAPITRATGLPTRVYTGLHEWGGVWEDIAGEARHFPGLGSASMVEIIPNLELPADVSENGWWTGAVNPLNEASVVRYARANANRFLHYLFDRYPDRTTIAIVTHGGFGSNLIEELLDIPSLASGARFAQNNTGHAMIDFDDHQARMHWHNRIDHLPDDIVTG